MIQKKLISKSNFWMTIVVGTFLVLLVMTLGLSFFNAIFYSQVESRKDFLVKQTELASRGMEMEIQRFQEDSRILLAFIEDPDLDEEDFQDELSTAVRRTFNSFPNLLDSVFIQLGDSVVVFSMTARNDMLRGRVPEMPQITDNSWLVVKSDEPNLGIVYRLDVYNFAKEYSKNFYINPGGGKFLIYRGQWMSLDEESEEISQRFDPELLDLVKTDVGLGLKSFYPIDWNGNRITTDGILAQYPFAYGKDRDRASLAFVVPTESLSSGINNTYFILFMGGIILLIGTVSFFILALRYNLNASKLQEDNLMEISRLFEQQNLLLKELKGFVFFHDYNGEITKVSDEVQEVLGHPKEDLIYAFRSDTSHPEAIKVKEQTFRALQEKREFVDFEYDFIKPDGEKIRVRVFEKLIFDEKGRLLGGIGICTDITNQYLARQETVLSENRLRTLINNLPDTLFIYDNEGKVLDFHVQDKKNFLEPAQFTLGKTLSEFVPHGQADEVIRVFRLARTTNRIQTTDVVWHSPTGDKHFEMRFFPLDENQMMSISKNNTGQKIWEKGLVEAMNAADQASRAKSEFLANMSHEIRTPMNGLLGIIDLLESTNLNKIQKQYVEIIKNSGSSLLGIIRDILDYSKIESGKIEIKRSVFDPVVELKNQIKILSGLATKKDIKLEVDCGDFGQVYLESDKEKINQVLLNLIGNAIKFTPEQGEVLIKMELNVLDEQFFFLSYSVKDSGIGIPQEHIGHLTDPFYQVESSTSRSYQGTGLGLAIAKKIIELLGGELEIQSEVEKGSVFSFSVLVKKADQVLPSPEKLELTWRDIKEMGTVFPLRILLAEDNDLNLQLMTLMFQQLGFQFEVAKNGVEVLEKIKNQGFDVVLMDVQMPVKNGLEATREIRAMKGKDKLIIIGLSANVFEEDQNKALESGMDDYLTKPIRLAALAGKLEFYYRKVREGVN